MDAQVPVRAGLFTSGPRGPRLLGGRCRSCGEHHFPRAPGCPYCSAEEVDEVELSAEGSLWAWTVVTAAPPGYRGEMPYGFGVVELPEGLRVVSRLSEPDPDRLHLGQRMRLEIVPLHIDDEGRTVVTYVFAPAEGQRVHPAEAEAELPTPALVVEPRRAREPVGSRA